MPLVPVATLAGRLISPTLDEFKFSSLVNTVAVAPIQELPSFVVLPQVMLEALRFKVKSFASILP